MICPGGTPARLERRPNRVGRAFLHIYRASELSSSIRDHTCSRGGGMKIVVAV